MSVDWNKAEQLLNVMRMSLDHGEAFRPLYNQAMSELQDMQTPPPPAEPVKPTSTTTLTKEKPSETGSSKP